MTYGPVNIPGSAYVYNVPNSDGIFGEVVRKVADPVQIRIANELSDVYYGAWSQGNDYQYGDWNIIVGDPDATRNQFNQLQHIDTLMGLVGFHFANMDMGFPVPEIEYRYIDDTYRYRPTVARNTLEPVYPINGAPLGPETYIDLLPMWVADMDRMESLLPHSTRGIRDYYIQLFYDRTGLDLTGIF
jgi:hypothetical protein